MQGPTAEVVSAYEAAMSEVELDDGKRQGVHEARQGASFLSWKVVEPKATRPNHLITADACAFRIEVQLNQPVRNGKAIIALRNHDGQLMCAWGVNRLHLAIGRHEIDYSLPSLPLRPGPYHWEVSLWEGYELLDKWFCLPDLIIATVPQTHPDERWTGILNVPCEIEIRKSD